MAREDKRAAAEAALPPELRPVFNQLVDDYQDAALTHAGGLWVNYKVLAELTLAGWRKEVKNVPSGKS